MITFISTAIISCSIPPPIDPNTTPRSTIRVDISNPEWNSPIVSSTSPAPIGPNMEVEITVSGLNSSNQATVFSRKIQNFNRNNLGQQAATFSVNDVEIPQTGAYVVEYRITSSECTQINTNTRLGNAFNAASKKRFAASLYTYHGGHS
jgi:hypothetical protein